MNLSAITAECIRPSWTENNVGLFLFWMRTGTAPEIGWIDPGDKTNIFNGEGLDP